VYNTGATKNLPTYATLNALVLTNTGTLEQYAKASFGLLKEGNKTITSTNTTPVTPSDPDWNNVTLLLKDNG